MCAPVEDDCAFEALDDVDFEDGERGREVVERWVVVMEQMVELRGLMA